MNLPTYIDVLGQLLDGNKPVCSVVNYELCNVMFDQDDQRIVVSKDDMTMMRNTVIGYCCDAVRCGDVEMTRDSEWTVLDTEQDIKTMAEMHLTVPVAAYVFGDPCIYLVDTNRRLLFLELTAKGLETLKKAGALDQD